jgi:hypothetical protein
MSTFRAVVECRSHPEDPICCDRACQFFGTWICSLYGSAPTPQQKPYTGRRMRCEACLAAEAEGRAWTHDLRPATADDLRAAKPKEVDRG